MLPAIDDYDSLGGELQNYAPVEDPLTDLDAEADNKARANTAAMTQTLPRAMCTGVLGLAPTVDLHRAVWGNSAAVKPTIARIAAGHFEISWPVSIVDARGGAHVVAFIGAFANMAIILGFRANCAITAPNKITVYTFSAVNVTADLGDVDFHLVAY